MPIEVSSKTTWPVFVPAGKNLEEPEEVALPSQDSRSTRIKRLLRILSSKEQRTLALNALGMRVFIQVMVLSRWVLCGTWDSER